MTTREETMAAKWLAKLEASVVTYMRDGAYLEFSQRQRRTWAALEKRPSLHAAVLSAWRAKHPA